MLLGVLLLLACRRERERGPADALVAEVDGRRILASDLEAYLAANLVGATPEEPGTPGDADRVKSRLLDNLIDEELLRAEAERRGIHVTDSEVDSLEVAGGERPAAEPASSKAGPEDARRGLLIQKLREADAREHAAITPAEIEAYVRENGAALRGKQRVRLRSLRFSDGAVAGRVRSDLIAKRTTFARAAADLHGTSGTEMPAAVSLQGLPEPVRRAVERLAPGQVSEPVSLDGTVFLFLVEETKDAGPGKTVEALAREELTEVKYRKASKDLVARLRRRSRIVLHEESLPFRYMPERAP
jgi:hypothetical protein